MPRLLALPHWLRPWQVTLFALVIYLVSVLGRASWDPMAFVRLGTRYDPGLPLGSMGYDGQFSYQIAIAPIESIEKLDAPAYRLQRILYPLVARASALGRKDLIPWTLVLVNLTAVTVGVALTERVMKAYGQSPWWAIAYGMNVGMFMAVRLDLNEPLAFAFVQAGVLAWAHNRASVSAAAFAVAALTKEVTVILLVGYLAARLLRTGLRSGLAWGAIALGPLLLWQAVLLGWLGDFGFASGGALSTPFEILPFRGWWALAFRDVSNFLTVSLLVVPMIIVPAIAGLVSAVKSLSSGLTGSAIALLLQAGVFLFLPTSNLVDPLGSARFAVGLIAATLNFGAELGWRRALAYSQLWILTLLFLPGDRFLPSG